MWVWILVGSEIRSRLWLCGERHEHAEGLTMVWISIAVEVHGVKDGEADVTNLVDNESAIHWTLWYHVMSISNYIVHNVVSHTLVYYLPCLTFQTIIPSQSNLVVLICKTSMLGHTGTRRHPQAEPVVAYPTNTEIKDRGCIDKKK